ncbi:MAG: sulfatase-like hydrolase/transferase [Akkermansiaceae bacterium]|nr:sulfatase-like hydrolase/transferase [Akkermansiaceae bacterium]MCF7730973.1 sulfatase-like hydrolase/transferase [Akkermansiaceae bacterium]
MKSTISLFAALAFACTTAFAAAQPVPAKPNILFILADDLGYGDVGCYNAESKVATPNLDRLVHDGMRFTDAHSPSTVCTPSRYSLLTGRMAFRINYRSVFETDPGEKVNLYFKHPEIVKELKALLDQSKASGRSRPEHPTNQP